MSINDKDTFEKNVNLRKKSSLSTKLTTFLNLDELGN